VAGAVAVGENVYHYTNNAGFINVLKDPMIAPWLLLKKASFAPHVGFAVIENKNQIIRKLEIYGKKCHDWAVVTLYLLSYSKFLTYAILTSVRWTTWIIAGLLYTKNNFYSLRCRHLSSFFNSF
jgi:hypothetical protein